jgi:hypothetical protein
VAVYRRGARVVDGAELAAAAGSGQRLSVPPIGPAVSAPTPQVR